MSPIFDFLFGQYSSYESYQILLEIIGVVFGIASAWYSKKNSVWVYPLGIISTTIFVYLLWQWGLLGDMLINAYYFMMSIFGWYLWTRKEAHKPISKITTTTLNEKKQSLRIFLVSMLFVVLVYHFFDKWNDWTAYIDTLTTGLFFVGMWLLAKHKIENWLFLLAGNFISVPLYFYKGYTISSILYLIFVLIAILGYYTWKKYMNNSIQKV